MNKGATNKTFQKLMVRHKSKLLVVNWSANQMYTLHDEPQMLFYQILAVVIPEGGHSTGARFPHQTKTEAGVDMHPELLLC